MKKKFLKVFCSIITCSVLTCATSNVAFAQTNTKQQHSAKVSVTTMRSEKPEWHLERTYTKTIKKKDRVNKKNRHRKTEVTKYTEASNENEAIANVEAGLDVGSVVLDANAQLKSSSGTKNKYKVVITIDDTYVLYIQTYKVYEITCREYGLRSPGGSLIDYRTEESRPKYIKTINGETWTDTK